MRPSTRLLIENIRACTQRGMTRSQTADALGMSYNTLIQHASAHGVDFRRKPRRNPDTSQRNRAICDRYLNGEKQADIANDLGLSRERVRQIIMRAGLVSEAKRHADFVAIVAGTVARKQLTLRQAAEMFGISKNTVLRNCQDHGVKPATRTAEEIAEMELLAREVLDGKSIRSAASRDRAKVAKLRAYLHKEGIEAKGRSRHDDFSQRRILLEKWRDAGLTWKACAKKLTKHDGKPICTGAVYTWARNNMPHLIPERSRSGLPKGVSVHRGAYQAQATINGKQTYIGRFPSPEAAAEAVSRAVNGSASLQ